jgi:hypothetical protein
MAGSIHISHPRKMPSDTADPTVQGRFFTVAGTGTGRVRKITFTLTDGLNNDVNIDDFYICRQKWNGSGTDNVNWVIVFEGVNQGSGYELTVSDPEQGHTTTPDSVTFSVGAAREDLLMTTWPASGAQISADSFAPYGTITEMVPMYAVLSVPGASPVTGSLVQGPPTTGDWVFQFSRLPTGSGATLTVYGGSLSQTVSNLTVQ